MQGPEFEFIYTNYVHKVFGFVLRLSRDRFVAEEITQETFVRAYSSIDNFKGKCKLEVWLCQIAKNLFFDYIKKRDHETTLELGDCEKNDRLTEKNIEDAMIDRERTEKLNELILRLKEPWRSVLIDRLFMELDYKEIALKYHQTENWARVNFYRAKQKVREWMNQEKGWEVK